MSLIAAAPDQISEAVARQILLVGAIAQENAPGMAMPGSVVCLAGVPVMVMKEISRDEFLDKVRLAGLSVTVLSRVPARARFFAVSAD